MPGPVPGIHVFLFLIAASKTWMAGTRPGHDVDSQSFSINPSGCGESEQPYFRFGRSRPMAS
jgi:hypothetical protein